MNMYLKSWLAAVVGLSFLLLIGCGGPTEGQVTDVVSTATTESGLRVGICIGTCESGGNGENDPVQCESRCRQKGLAWSYIHRPGNHPFCQATTQNCSLKQGHTPCWCCPKNSYPIFGTDECETCPEGTTLNTTTHECEDNKPVVLPDDPECTNGASQCVDDMLFFCVGGEWIDHGPCGDPS